MSLLSLLAIATLPALSLGAPAARAPGDSGRLADAIGEYLRRAEAFGFSGAVVVEIGGTPIVHAGFGAANRRTGSRVSTTTPFYVASVSKQFVATAIMRLVDAGKIRTTDSVARFFPDVPADKRGITVHHLLTHTSGIRDASDGPAVSAEEFVRAEFSRPLASAPGERQRYSNIGYGLLAAIIERASGTPYAAFMQTTLFAPLGMRDTYVVGSKRPTGQTRAYRGVIDFGDVTRVHGRPVTWRDVSGTGIVTTSADLLRWERALRGRTLLSEKSQRAMLTPYAESFGYGWTIQTTARGTRAIAHNGLVFPEGWNSDYRRFPEDSVTVIVLSNTFREDALGHIVARHLVRLVFGGDVPFPPPAVAGSAAQAATLAGEYVLPDSGRFRIVARGAALTLEPVGQAAVNLVMFGTTRDTFGLAAATQASRRLVDALRDDAFDRIRGDLGEGLPLEEWRRRLRETWDSLATRHGAYQSATVVSAVPSAVSETAVDTYVRLRFARDSVLVRHSWGHGRLLGASDIGSFPAGYREVELVPSPMPLVAQPGGQFAVANLVTGRVRRFRVRRDETGAMIGLDVVGAGPVVTATRVRSR